MGDPVPLGTGSLRDPLHFRDPTLPTDHDNRAHFCPVQERVPETTAQGRAQPELGKCNYLLHDKKQSPKVFDAGHA